MSKDIEEIFDKHWEYYSQQSAETLKQQSGQIEQVSGDYQGRVLYELLQNAFDRAEKSILIQVDETYLYVANDEGRFTFTQNYDYRKGNSLRGDFQSLCSISTSTKNSKTSIGNKGVGFKSVYSLNNYADIFVKPSLVGKEEKGIDEWISFRVYDEIRQTQINTIKKINENVEHQLDWIVHEYPNRGIPGFYYPILLDEELKNFEESVTVVRVKHNKKIDELIEELKNIHFYFVSLKYKREIRVAIDTTDTPILKSIKTNSLISYRLENKINDLSKKTTLATENPQVGIYYKKIDNNYDDLIYNYMPTKVISPFKMVDFQGDFQSTVDRKGIDLDKGDIAEYNKALLRACIELHFINLSTYLDEEFNGFNLKYVKPCNIEKVNLDKDDFWKYLQINDSLCKKLTIKIIKNIFNGWGIFGDFIAKLASKYFKQDNLTIENFDNFWKIVFDYSIIAKSYQKGIWAVDTYTHLNNNYIKKLSDVNCIPIIKENEIVEKRNFKDKILYSDEDKTLPTHLNIFITNYNFNNNIEVFFKKDFDIELKKFSNDYELLKHFRQIPKDGNCLESKLDEDIKKAETKQKEILISLYEKYKEKEFGSTHRYSKYISKDLRDKANIENNAYFAISTLFLKLEGKNIYKPAQLCRKKDLDLKFYDKLKYDNFLQFLGVSLDDQYIFCEGKIYDNCKDGLAYIPAIVDEGTGELKASEIIPNISIVDLELVNPKKKFAWQCYKNNNYEPILKEIKTKNKSLNEIVKPIKNYPKEYLEELVKILNDNSDIEATKKLYQAIFNRQLEVDSKSKDYLIYNNGAIELSVLDGVFIPKTRNDFNIIWKYKNKIHKKFLMAFTDKFDSEDLKLSIVEETK